MSNVNNYKEVLTVKELMESKKKAVAMPRENILSFADFRVMKYFGKPLHERELSLDHLDLTEEEKENIANILNEK